MIFIYGLVDPRTLLIRYIGWAKDTDARFNSHLYDRSRTHKVHWIQELISLDLEPILVILDCGTDYGALEKWWIAYGRASEWPLTNGTDGGDGGNTWINSVKNDERRVAISERMIGNQYNVGKKNRLVDITGQKFGRLTAIQHIDGRYWEFLCDCGSTHVANKTNVVRGLANSCGCLHSERSATRSAHMRSFIRR